MEHRLLNQIYSLNFQLVHHQKPSLNHLVKIQKTLMRVFGGAQVESLMNRFGLEDDVPLEAGIVSKAIETAQKKVEGFNFDRRKQLVEMDDVMNVHREVI